MELKSWVVGENVAGIKSSNRTFMELKFIRKLYSSMSRPVLIAPLWNWNDGEFTLVFFPYSVLIAPLWNASLNAGS